MGLRRVIVASAHRHDRPASVRSAVVAAVVCVALLWASPGFAAKSQADQLRAQLAQINREAKRVGDAYSKAYGQLEKTNSELAKTTRDLKKTEAELAAASGRLSKHLAELYRQGNVNYLELLFTSETLDDMLMRVEYAQRVGMLDAQTVDKTRRLRDELQARRNQVADLKAKRAKDAAALKKKADALEKKLKSLQKEYEAVQRKLAQASGAGSSGGSSRRYPPGPNGMVFPVAGPCYYSDTWGAPRSGGRRHKGTDIMAARGTPCVAVLSGTVRARYNSLGGKTLWLTADNGWAFYYAHLDSYVRTSGRVAAGEVIGRVGNTGNARGGAPHLHFEIHPNGGAAVDPYPYLRQMQ
ncbi:peptidoglycan DD-metalloendopeptidase family protein [Coriobacteriia bacterium Es71-Z0120]|jgi:murein DD-endopeptidase MepM/ murein hydrolase activator NlpD|uniref:murein hydrolase activator EnvC family protein n=1 Tax=Parvivirga hydrogeniphila TaxID=2939460 RepID=UPI002260FC18|nr:M23 family metallopeptidase [Parvivirga hydrogeniphila]MCL4079543.1 peptidoglycan DD-metalloendopeptidase family protein [Parvivirga hydrogeniphila]